MEGRGDSGVSLLVPPTPKAQWGATPFTGEDLGLPCHRSLETPRPLVRVC